MVLVSTVYIKIEINNIKTERWLKCREQYRQVRRGGVWACICICVASPDPRQIPLHVGPRLVQWREHYCWQWLDLLPEILQVRTRGLLEGGGGNTSKEEQPWKKRGTQQHLYQQLKRLEYPVLLTYYTVAFSTSSRQKAQEPTRCATRLSCLLDAKELLPYLVQVLQERVQILSHNDTERVAWRPCLELPTY